jgi:undecaprenyl diphosphate synthase
MDVLWPDFNKQSLQQAVDEFHQRERRYGASSG